MHSSHHEDGPCLRGPPLLLYLIPQSISKLRLVRWKRFFDARLVRPKLNSMFLCSKWQPVNAKSFVWSGHSTDTWSSYIHEIEPE